MLSRLFFFLSVLVLAVGYGSVAAFMQWAPYPQIASAASTALDLKEHWRNDFGLTPTRQLVAAAPSDRPEYRRLNPTDVRPGGVLISGSLTHRGVLQGVALFGPAGDKRHHWAIDYEALDPEGPRQTNVLLHGMAPFEDGSVVVAFDAGGVLARISACGAPQWVVRGGFHHAVTRDDDGGLWTWRGDSMVRVDAESGEILTEIDLRRDLIETSGAHGALGIRMEESAEGLVYQADPFHANDVEALSREMAPAFPQFEAGDLLISLRDLNLVAVVDPNRRELKWWRHGPWFRQHDPDFQPDGRITVYDNRMGLDGGSRILAIDPETDAVETLFAHRPDAPFDSWRRGKHQVLADGAILIAESEKGRVFEVNEDGALVWERQMIFDDARNVVITDATHVPPGFFREGVFDCP
ncbi:MAG: arylsulfotransferase family protein [Pseudomonadota bacterium]